MRFPRLGRLMAGFLPIAALCGCPSARPAGPPASPPAGRTAPAPSTPPARSLDPGRAPTRVTVERPAPPGPEEPFSLRPGRAQPLPGTDVQLGCVLVQGAPEPSAELTVMIGPMSFPVLARPGTVIPVGAARAAVEGIDGAVRLRWTRPMPRAADERELVLEPRSMPDGTLLVREMSLARLPGGGWLGVGNVTPLEGEPVVTLHVYPGDYPADVGQGYDRFVDAKRGERLLGKVARFQLERLAEGDPGRRPGLVLLRPLG